ncbi:MAG: tocopherol cyclase family protein [Eubacteriales bacterium]|nr:tocopherol cyclase family protein [Eubacteriales bacterium]
MGDYFEGYYYKHQKGDNVLSLIVGKSNTEEFIQIITNDFSCNVPFIGNNKFSSMGVKLDIQTDKVTLTGEIAYEKLTPIKYDIMGPFKYFPMECRHGVISMYHKLSGRVILNGIEIDFTDGIGYIEKDSGTSFPSSYVWVQANDFTDKCFIMASVANIPFMKISFRGCICVIMYNGTEYRLATYLGAKILTCTRNRIIIKQGKYKLIIKIKENTGYKLNAPSGGEMTRTIIETASCSANFTFYIKGKLIFTKKSNHTSFEFEE